MLELSTIQQISIWILPMLFAITIHEASHAWVAARCGDTTAKALGRLSMNPIKHIDLIGTILVPIVILIFTHFNFAFGWAKPVPINPNFFKHRNRDEILVAFAGPLSNLLMALTWTGIAKLAILSHPDLSIIALFFLLSAKAGIVINLVLGFLNLLPIPPLDGGRIVAALLPHRWAIPFQKLERFGFLILLALMLTGVLAIILNPIMNASIQFLQQLINY